MSEQVEVEIVVVGEGGGRELLADLYRPRSPNGCGVLLIYGGGFVQGDRSQLRGYAIALGRAGYTSLACEYRLVGEALWSAPFDDVMTAFAYLHREAKSLGLAPTKLAVSGNSAGGCLALLVAAQVLPVAAAIAFYAPVDFLGDDARAKGAPRGLQYLFGEDVSDERLASASPITYVGLGFPPTLFLTGNRDELVHWGESVRMYESLLEAGSRAELHVFDGVEHAFDMRPEYGRLSAAIMTQFLDSHVNASTHAGSIG